MPTRFLISFAAAAAVCSGVLASEADAGWLWRRSKPSRTQQQLGPSSFKYSSGISRGEYERFRRMDAWYNEAYNGFKPSDFR